MTAHVFSLLNVVALAKSQFILDTVIERQVIARPQDLVEVLKITRDMIDSNYTGIPKDKVAFYNEIFVPYYKSKLGPDTNDKGEVEPFKAVTTKGLCDEFKKKKHRGITTSNLKHTYLDELIRNDLIGEERSKIDGRQNIYYPLVELGELEVGNNDYVDNNKQDNSLATSIKVKKLLNISKFNNFLQAHVFGPYNNHNKVPEWWLISQIFTLLKYRIKIPKLQSNVLDLLNTSEEFKLLEMNNSCSSSDNNDNAAAERRLTIKEFVSTYDNNPALSIQYIFGGSLPTSNTRNLANLRNLYWLTIEQCKKLLNQPSFNNFFILINASARYNSVNPYEIACCLRSSRGLC
jgi:hypothetical protein